MKHQSYSKVVLLLKITIIIIIKKQLSYSANESLFWVQLNLHKSTEVFKKRNKGKYQVYTYTTHEISKP